MTGWLRALGVLCALGYTLAASTEKPQGHQGLVKPFKPGPPSVTLSKADIEKLRKGDAVRQQLDAGSGGRGLVVQDVHAPPEVVWGRILDFPAYTRMVPRVSICENYLVRDKPKEGLKEIFTRMRLTVMGFHVEYFIHHRYHPKLNTIVWTLDYDRESDLDDSVGYWHVIPHPDPDRPHWSRVYYSIDMRLKSWMPGFVKNVLKNQALTQATAWVRKESEKIGVPKHLLNQRKPGLGQGPVDLKGLQDKADELRGGWCKLMKDARDRVQVETAKIPQAFKNLKGVFQAKAPQR